jgi:D-alanyl-lipoteichoic acid acyltransferase DltB (MBOAT superfamily)
VLGGVVLVAGVTALLLWRPAAGRWLNLAVAALIGLLLVTKFEPLGQAASAALRGLAGQPRDLASATDLRWLGFSYLSFRLIHILRDRAAGRLPQVSLREFVTYAVFFPAYTAGPIDRLERFVKDERQPFKLDAEAILAGGSRIAVGVLKKFVLADSLAILALNATNAAQTASPLWMWVLVYAYAWRLYLDFSGYSDIAIGLGRFFGIKLPENFDRPYLKPNLTLFWNSWHITLAQWFRAYVFNPLTRALRARPLPPAAIILTTQLVTMVLIGLWHGVTWNFVIWGAWHGAGLFIHNRWADFMKRRGAFLSARPRLAQAARVGGILLTFHFVALGWVWFALPDTALALTVFRRLFGL